MFKSSKIFILLFTLMVAAWPAHADRTGTIVSAGVTVGASANTFASAYCDEINGCPQAVADTTTRDAIPAARRTLGMPVYVIANDTTYRLVGGITNSNWVVVNANVAPITLAYPNVGIGSVAPSAVLDVNGTVKTNAGFQSTANTGSVGWLAGLNGLQFDGAHSTLTSPNLAITTAGNVGIGTNAAASTLTVNGTTETKTFKLSTGPSSGYVLTSNSTGIGTWAPVASSGAGLPGGSNGSLQRNNAGALDGVTSSSTDTNGNIGIGTTTNTYKLNVGGRIAEFSTGDSWFNLTSGNMGIGTNLPVGKMTVVGNLGIGTTGDNFVKNTPPAGGLIVKGNVGIGTWLPRTLLEVAGTVRATGLQVAGNVGITTTCPTGHIVQVTGGLISSCY